MGTPRLLDRFITAAEAFDKDFYGILLAESLLKQGGGGLGEGELAEAGIHGNGVGVGDLVEGVVLHFFFLLQKDCSQNRMWSHSRGWEAVSMNSAKHWLRLVAKSRPVARTKLQCDLSMGIKTRIGLLASMTWPLPSRSLSRN